MALKKFKPTTPSSRSKILVVNSELSSEGPYAPLVESKSRTCGRNNNGRITVRHRGGGHKRNYRIIDFKRDKFGVGGSVERLEYDPNRSAYIALICYKDGERRYIVAPDGLKSGMEIIADSSTPVKVGNAMQIKNIPVGTSVHCIEMKPGHGAQLVRSAGTSAQVLGRDGIYAQVRLRSGEIRRIPLECMATVGEVCNSEHNLRSFGKAGAKRWLGIRPTVRGVAMNPIDHPHGGGEGKTAAGRHPVSPWGLHTKGKKTRRTKRTDYLIVKSRHR